MLLLQALLLWTIVSILLTSAAALSPRLEVYLESTLPERLCAILLFPAFSILVPLLMVLGPRAEHRALRADWARVALSAFWK